jgi:putative flippase GtrA
LRATVGRPAATLPPPRPRLVASLLSVRNWQQLGKFCVVGAVGYLINLAVYDALLHEGVHYLVAATCSFLVAVTSNYTWNRLWTFRELRGHFGVQGMRFFAVSLAALGANLFVLHLLIADGGLAKLPAQAVAIVAVTPLNFVGNKLWSFRRRSAQ